MKTIIVQNKSTPEHVLYPKLMIDRECLNNKSKEPLIVLFINEIQGVVISAPKEDIKNYREEEFFGNLDWSKGATDITFVPFIGEITLVGE